MIRVMLDTDNLSIMGPWAPIMATYSDLVEDYETLQFRVSPSKLILIDRKLGDPTRLASVCDIEPGAWAPEEYGDWYDLKGRQGVTDRAAYCDRSELAAVTESAHGRAFYRWVATLDGTAHIDGCTPLHAPDAVQILGDVAVGSHFDLSLVYNAGWHATEDLAWVPSVKATLASMSGYLQTMRSDVSRIMSEIPHT